MSEVELKQYLAERWCALLIAVAPPPALVDLAFDELIAAYSAPMRHYHGLRHIAALLKLAEAHAAEFSDRVSVEFAIFYHDAIYDITRKDNESASARLAEARLLGLGIERARVARVTALIEATAHGLSEPDAGDADLLRFLDLDLSILAAPRTDYVGYAAGIRAEYVTVPEQLYLAGRRKVLQSFLAQARIYRSSELYRLWETSARNNIHWEIDELDRGAIPGGRGT